MKVRTVASVGDVVVGIDGQIMWFWCVTVVGWWCLANVDYWRMIGDGWALEGVRKM